ncbi:hypothetical protein NYV46_24745 [Escherichia coli]|nr:hypothetical protein [Escherichia coli]
MKTLACSDRSGRATLSRRGCAPGIPAKGRRDVVATLFRARALRRCGGSLLIACRNNTPV